MHTKRIVLFALSSVLVVSAVAVAASSRQDGAQMMPKPSPEHAYLMQRVGTWDAVMSMWMDPGEPMKVTGVETNRAIGEFHVVSEYKADFMGMPFEGHGVMSYDPAKKKYVSLWVDALAPSPSISEGTYDERTKTITFVGEATREVVSLTDADHAIIEMFSTGADGKEAKSMQIDFTRRK
jgi:hypothetical protein